MTTTEQIGRMAHRNEALREERDSARDEVAHLHFALEIREGEVQHLRTQLGLVPAPGLFRGLWRLFRDRTERQVTKVRRMS